ncbi:MAG: hypothetical protein GY827_04880 [Cytophagales bacterium]|nr:hypothetical protein [Cytophagales bacterium]
MEKKYTIEDIRAAFDAGCQRGAYNVHKIHNFVEEPLCREGYVDSLENPIVEEPKDIPITYYQIKKYVGWSKFCDVTGGNQYAINEFGEPDLTEIYYIKESQANELGF